VPIVGLGASPSDWQLGVAVDPAHHYVDEVDVGQVEALRRTLQHDQPRPAAADAAAVPDARTSCEPSTGSRTQLEPATKRDAVTSGHVHIGIATRRPTGCSFLPCATPTRSTCGRARPQWRGSAEAARTSKASREELSGSTITITSLGAPAGW